MSLRHAVPLLSSGLTAYDYNVQFASVMQDVECKDGRKNRKIA
jgi:hypothetical protein